MTRPLAETTPHNGSVSVVSSREGYQLAEEDIYPRDRAHQFRIYARRGKELEVLACAGSPEALGVALIQLDMDERERGRRLVDLGCIGVLDAVEGRWILLPWQRPEVAVTAGPPPRRIS